MNLIALRYFIAVAECGSFTKASEVLFVTQPTLSRQIADLEDELGAKLFVRQSRSLVLTEAGKICLSEAHKIVNHCDKLVSSIRDSESSIRGSLDISYFLGTDILNDVIATFQRIHPNVTIHLTSCGVGKLTEPILDNKCDVVFCVKALADIISGSDFLHMQKSKLHVIVPGDHLLAGRKSVSIGELRNERFVMFERSVAPDTVDILMDLCRKEGFVPKVSRYVYDAQSMLYSVSAGQGICLGAGYMKEVSPVKNIQYLNLDECGVDANLGFCYKANNTNPVLSAFLETAKNLQETT